MGKGGNQNINQYRSEGEEVRFYVVYWWDKPDGMKKGKREERWFFEHEEKLAIKLRDKVGGYIPDWCLGKGDYKNDGGKVSIHSSKFMGYWTKAKNRTKRKPSKRWTHDIPTGVKDFEYKIMNGIPFTRAEARRMNKKGIKHKALRNNWNKEYFYDE